VTFKLDTASLARETVEVQAAAQNQMGWVELHEQTFPDAGHPFGWEVLPATGPRWGVAEIDSGNYGAWVNTSQIPDPDYTSTYTDNMDSWFIYRVANAQDIWRIRMEFNYLNNSAEGDYFIVGYSYDGENFTGHRDSGVGMSAWHHAETAPYSVNRPEEIWYAFGFTSNDDGLVDNGAWVDDIHLYAYYGTEVYLPTLSRGFRVGPEYLIYDDFSDTGYNWPTGSYDQVDGDETFMEVGYRDAEYRTYVPIDYQGDNNWQMTIIRSPVDNDLSRYDVSVEQHWLEANEEIQPEESKASLIFGASEDYSSLYAFEWNFRGNCAINRYDGVAVPVTEIKHGPGDEDLNPDLDTTEIMGWRNCHTYGFSDQNYGDTIQVLVEVRDTTATVYTIDGGTRRQVHSFTASGLGTRRDVGFISGSWNLTPVEMRFDNFYVQAQ
jgi:hypothetical protein